MTAFNWKTLAAAAALSAAALGLGSGVANADDDAVLPVQPGGTSSDWQSYLPLLTSIGSFVDLQKLGVPQDVANYANLGELGNLGGLGGLGGLGNGQWQNIAGLVGG